MMMTMVRQDDRPARRRYRHERLAVLVLLALGSNLGCGRETLRVPAGHAGPQIAAPPMPMSAMRGQPSGPSPVALWAEHGSSLDELFSPTYRELAPYGSRLSPT